MDRIRRCIAAYNELKVYRSGNYAAEFARNNLRNTLLIVALLLVVTALDTFLCIFGSEIPGHRIGLLAALFLTTMFGAGLVLFYMHRPLTSRNREHMRNMFFSATILIETLLCFDELTHMGTLYNYMMLMTLVASLPNFKLRETVTLVTVVDIIVVALLQNPAVPAVGRELPFDVYKVMAFFSIFCVGIAVRNHIDYLMLMRERCRLRAASEKDPLTGVLNRRGMEMYLQNRGYKGRVIACIFDVDDFKCYNDSFGHAAGDTCLRRVAHCLQGIAAATDAILVRYGGEEFVVLFFTRDMEGVQKLVERGMSHLSDWRIPAGQGAVNTYVTISGGMAVSNGRMQSVDAYYSLISLADAKLYMAKTAGKMQLVH